MKAPRLFMALILVSGLPGLTLNAQRTVSIKMDRHYKLWVECAGEYGELTAEVENETILCE